MSQQSLFGPSGMERDASLSDCGTFRYSLGRHWDGESGTVNWIMLNPSKADASIDDATIRRCIAFSKAWGYGGLIVTNLFALRSTDPAALKTAADPIGPENDRFLVSRAMRAEMVVAGWGAHGTLRDRALVVRLMLAGVGVRLHCLKTTGDGEPGHPLYLPANLTPKALEASRA